MTASQVDAVKVVSAREYGKLVYLLTALKLFDQVYQDFKRWRETVAFQHGVTVDARIDWRAVAIYCAPQVLVMMTHDKTGREFEDFPLYAVLPETCQVIRLENVESMSVEVSDEGETEVNVRSALKTLDTYVQSIDGGKKENAVKNLRILERILR
jgi:hypothetical protein